jgi:DtxR family Mn-dependent transcriptional regulator
MATISKENYLKAIFTLSQENGKIVPTSSLAKELEISNAAITEMANRLAVDGLVEYKKYKGIRLLKRGEKIAINVLRKHRLWELFLIKTLNINWSEVHAEAEKLEHCTSEYLANKIDKFLEYPKLDPHGAPIPNDDGTFRAETNSIPLTNCIKEKSYIITRVNDKNPELIKYLSQIKISLNKIVTIHDKFDFDGSIIVEIDNTRHSLSEKLIENIFVCEV